jgi:hypothetical protein
VPEEPRSKTELRKMAGKRYIEDQIP